MIFCKKCILPDTRPNLVIGSDGVCNACKAHEEKKLDINWGQRKQFFLEVVKRAKERSKGYDCLIPVSGGKDSTWQVITCLEYGMNPLAVTWRTPSRTEIGQKNLDNLISLGVDHIDYTVNPKIEKLFLLKALERYGSVALPMHMGIFNIPLTIAHRLDIPLIVYGENSAFEYGGTEEEKTGFRLDSKWKKVFGVTHGTTAEDWISEEMSKKELTAFFGPNDEELESKGITAIFLGYYLEWSPQMTLDVATKHGFHVRKEGPKTGYYNYADIDDNFISIHHFVKWYKFGFTRLFDNLSIEIRDGRITRDEALDILRQYGEQIPHEDIHEFCDFVGITREHFFKILEKFRNHNIWSQQDGKWKMKDFIITDWVWK
jgi:N-acetyl sugar amidotransferase